MSVVVAITVTHMFNAFAYNSIFLLCNIDVQLQSLPHSLPHPQIIHFLKSIESAVVPIRDSTGELVSTTERSAVPGLSSLLLQPGACPSLEIFPCVQCQPGLFFSSLLPPTSLPLLPSPPLSSPLLSSK